MCIEGSQMASICPLRSWVINSSDGLPVIAGIPVNTGIPVYTGVPVSDGLPVLFQQCIGLVLKWMHKI